MMAEIHMIVRIQLTDNGNERLPGRNCCLWPLGAIKGGHGGLDGKLDHSTGALARPFARTAHSFGCCALSFPVIIDEPYRGKGGTDT